MKKNDTRNTILDAAIDLFWARSYHGVNMNELSRAAGVNKATVYQHFSSKQDLAIAGIKRAGEATNAYIYDTSFSQSNDARERLELIYNSVFEMHSAIHSKEAVCRGCPFVNLGVELSTSVEEIRQAIAQVIAGFEKYYQRIIEADNEGKRHPIDAKSGAATLMTIMNGCLVASKIENRPQAILEGKQRAVDFLQG